MHNTLLVHPVGMPCVRTRPDAAFWGQRDIFGIIQAMARSGSVPVTQVPDDLGSFEDFSQIPAGWRAYGILVPPGGDLKVSLDHPNRGWFSLRMCNKWGQLEKGMLQNVLHTFEPVVTYHNHKSKPDWVYIIADDPGWMSSTGNPYRITIDRSWPPMVLKGIEPKIVVGIWAATRQREQDTFVEQFRPPDPEKPTRP